MTFEVGGVALRAGGIDGVPLSGITTDDLLSGSAPPAGGGEEPKIRSLAA